jgi:hypothetical protein
VTRSRAAPPETLRTGGLLGRSRTDSGPGPGGSRRLVQHCTSGKGVADLHMRVAGRPKYYTFPEYKFFQMSDLVYYMFV